MDEHESDATLRRLLLLAEEGSAYAQTQLGHMYTTGDGVPVDDREAVSWFRMAAEQGEADAQFWLGRSYAEGEGVEADDHEAVFWWRKAAVQGHADAQYSLGLSYSMGEAAKQGIEGTQFRLGVVEAKGEGVPEDDHEAMFWYREAAEQGHAEAQCTLGHRYAYGTGVEADDQEAASWYRKAAEQGHADAQYSLARMHSLYDDDRRAVFWYREAAQQGHMGAQFGLVEAAERGAATAQLGLGDMYAEGWAIPADDREAAFWYHEAAKQGDSEAQLKLGDMYANGEGVAADRQEAVFWYCEAAEQGDAYAQFRLGLSYANGKGVPEDDIQAYAWTNLASVQGREDAQQHRARIRRRMTSTQVVRAQALSCEFAAWIADCGDESTLAPIFADPVRAPGPSHDAVHQAQSYLVLLGYDTGPLDGLPGQCTTVALRHFQQDQGITPTGRISEELLALLRAMAAARENPPADPVSSGTGFLVGQNGWIVTNHHIVDGHDRVTVSRAGASHDATVHVVEAFYDLALLKVPVEVGEGATFSDSPRASLGEAAMVAGFPLHGLLSSEFNVTMGNVSALAGPGDDAKLLQVTAPVQPGNSGGPLLDAAGNVIGVVVSRLNTTRGANLSGEILQNVNFALKGPLVRGFLDIHGVTYRQRPSNAKLTSEKLAELARTFTVAVHCWD